VAVDQGGVAPPDEPRVSLRLSQAAMSAVQQIMRFGRFQTPQAAVRRAIADERFLQQKLNEGWTVLIRKGDEYKELVWNREHLS
jgi:hypothetical protein